MNPLERAVIEAARKLALGAGECTAAEAECSSIPVEWIEVGGVRIGLDSAGSAVRVELPYILYGWTAE